MTPFFADTATWDRFKPILLSWIGTPYRHLAMRKGRGADCTLFIAACWQEFGILDAVTYDYYSKDWHVHTDTEMAVDNLYTHFSNHAVAWASIQRMPTSEPLMRGDLLTFYTTPRKLSNHAAVFLDDDVSIIHANPRRGVSIFPLEGYFSTHMTNIFRIVRREPNGC